VIEPGALVGANEGDPPLAFDLHAADKFWHFQSAPDLVFQPFGNSLVLSLRSISRLPHSVVS